MKVSDFIGERAKYDNDGQYIWGVSKEGGHQMIADLRGWGAIQNLFKLPKGAIDIEKAEKFQDEVGEWIVAAINEKLENDKNKEV